MAIVSTETGGLVPCTGGDHLTADGNPAVKALSWREVDGVVDRFTALNPYDRASVPGSILKIEEDNFEPETREQRQIHCFAISAKRYALFAVDSDSAPLLLRKGVNNGKDRGSQHGLGHLLNPIDPRKKDRKWIAAVWQEILHGRLDAPRIKALGSTPAVGRITVSSPHMMKSLMGINEGKPYGRQIKPFNFLLTAHLAPFGHPVGVDPTRFHLIAPYDLDSRNWARKKWIDVYFGRSFHISAHDDVSAGLARVKSYADVIAEYKFHPEAKCADSDGNVCQRQTVGLLRRRQIRIFHLHYIGKESNRLEEVRDGIVHRSQDVYTEYVDAKRDEWELKVLPWLRRQQLKQLMEALAMSKRALLK